jgi:hypothetical protein
MNSPIFQLFLSFSILIIIIIFAFYYHFFLCSDLPSPISRLYPIFKSSFLPFLGIIWYFISQTHPRKIYFYLLFSWLADILMIAPDFHFVWFGGVFFFFLAHLTMALHYSILWFRLPCYIFFLMFLFIWIPTRFLVPQLGSGNLKAVCCTIYCAALEIGVCGSVGRLSGSGCCKFGIVSGTIGYLIFLIMAVFDIWGKLDEFMFERIESAKIVTYIFAQLLIVLSASVKDGKKTD